MTLKERQWQLRQDAILDAAYEVIAERGTAGACMDDIAARAGVSKPTLYQHFESKDELVVSVSMRLMRNSERALAARSEGTPALEHLARTLRNGLVRRAGLWSARVTVPRELADANPAYQRQRAAVQARLTKLVEEAKAEGDIAARFPTPVVVRMLQRLFRGDYEDLLGSGVVTTDELGEVLIAVTFDGLRPRETEIAAGVTTEDTRDHGSAMVEGRPE
ncbi:MAG TPA: TetR/AcrR family transcriptional regulator [Longimicrobiaceae bacterium]|nr:TetR/AcrR family transcriptional regulator [Longimicrobiaceae bacterium]